MALIGILMAVSVSAALLTYFGTVNTDLTVDQAVTLTGDGCADNDCLDTAEIYGGEGLRSKDYTLTSLTSVDAPLELTNQVSPDDPGITITNHYLLHSESKLFLSADDLGITVLNDLTSFEFTNAEDSAAIIVYFGSEAVQFDTNSLSDSSSDGVQTLADWKGTNGADSIIGIQIVTLDILSDVTGMSVNGNPIDIFTIKPGEKLDFYTMTQFLLGHVGEYDITTQVDIRN